MAYYGSCRLLMMGSCLRKQLPVFCSFRPDSEADKKLLFSSGFQLYFTGATENYSGAFRPQMYLCNYWESSAKSCGYPPPTGWLFLVYPEDETLCVINQFRNTVRKPKSFEAIEVNYFLAISNLVAQQAKTPYPGGARWSWNLLVLMCLRLQHTVLILRQPPSL